MARNFSVQNAQLALLVRLAAAALDVSRGRPVWRLVVGVGLKIGIQLLDALGITRQRLQGHRAVDKHRQHRDRFSASNFFTQ